MSEKGVWQTNSVLYTGLCFSLYTQTDTCLGTSVTELVPNYSISKVAIRRNKTDLTKNVVLCCNSILWITGG